MDKIKRVSRFFRMIFMGLFVFELFLPAFIWITLNTPYNISGWPFSVHPPFITVNLTTRLLGYLASLIPTIVILFGIVQIIKILRNYEIGQIFTLSNAQRYRKLGYTILGYFFGDQLATTLYSIILTFQNHPLHKAELDISFGTGDLYTLILGGAIILIAWVMTEAHQLSEEQTLTI